MCIKYTSEAGKKGLMEHNKRFSTGNRLLPPIDEEKAMYGSLAGSHFNLALRLIQSGSYSPIGNLSDMMDEQPHLKMKVKEGHVWTILSEETPLVAQQEISLWKNMDQNDNQGIHEIEILQNIKMTALSLSKSMNKVSMGDLVAFVGKSNPAKIKSSLLMTLCRYYIGFLNNGVPELVGTLWSITLRQ